MTLPVAIKHDCPSLRKHECLSLERVLFPALPWFAFVPPSVWGSQFVCGTGRKGISEICL